MSRFYICGACFGAAKHTEGASYETAREKNQLSTQKDPSDGADPAADLGNIRGALCLLT